MAYPLMYLLIGMLSPCIMYAVRANGDHDLFMKQDHFYELGIQIQYMREKLYANCPKVFQTPDRDSVAIIGRRRTVDTSLDLKIELAEKTLEKLILKYGNCTGTTIMTSRKTTILPMSSQSTITPIMTSKEITTIRPTSPQPTTTNILYTTTNRHQHAFQVLQSKNVTYNGYDFLVLEVRVPVDGLSKSSNWCFDYQYLCEDFHRRPTGCGTSYAFSSTYAYRADCRDKYNSDMEIGDALGCNPSRHVANLTNIAFPNLSSPAKEYKNSFAFHTCQNCNKTIQGSEYALTYMSDFWNSNVTTFNTVCR